MTGIEENCESFTDFLEIQMENIQIEKKVNIPFSNKALSILGISIDDSKNQELVIEENKVPLKERIKEFFSISVTKDGINNKLSLFSQGASFAIAIRIIDHYRECNKNIQNKHMQTLANNSSVVLAGMIGRIHLAIVTPLRVLKETVLIPVGIFTAIKLGIEKDLSLGNIRLESTPHRDNLFGYEIKTRGFFETALSVMRATINPLTTIANTALFLTIGFEAISNEDNNFQLYNNSILKISSLINAKFIK